MTIKSQDNSTAFLLELSQNYSLKVLLSSLTS